MKNRRKLYVLFITMLIILICISGCSKSKEKKVTENVTTTFQDSRKTLSPAPSEAPVIYYNSSVKSEKKLVWATDIDLIRNVDKEIFDEMNRKLVEKYNCDFTVDIVGVKSDDYNYYQKKIREMKRQGKQVDVLYTGLGYEGKPDTYPEAVKDGLLLPMTDLLQDNKYGRKLYQTFTSKFWKAMQYKGTVYGFRPLAEEGSFRSFIIANDKYFKLNRVKSSIGFDELEGMLKKVMNTSKGIPNTVLPVYIDSAALTNLEGYIVTRSGYDGIYYKKVDGKWKFVNAADEERIAEIWKKIQKFQTINNYQGGDAFEKFRSAEYCIAIAPIDLTQINGNKAEIYSASYNVTELASKEAYHISPQNVITGITSWSDYPKEAMKFLSLIETKKDISNLLYYGLEGKHYNLNNNRVQALDYKGKLPTNLPIANAMITYPEGMEPDNKAEIYRERNEEAAQNPEIIYQIDYGKYLKQMEEIFKIYAGFDGLWNGVYEDVDTTIEELQKKLKAAGIDELIDNLNRLIKVK